MLVQNLEVQLVRPPVAVRRPVTLSMVKRALSLIRHLDSPRVANTQSSVNQRISERSLIPELFTANPQSQKNGGTPSVTIFQTALLLETILSARPAFSVTSLAFLLMVVPNLLASIRCGTSIARI